MLRVVLVGCCHLGGVVSSIVPVVVGVASIGHGLVGGGWRGYQRGRGWMGVARHGDGCQSGSLMAGGGVHVGGACSDDSGIGSSFGIVHLLGETAGLDSAEVSLGEHLHTGRVDGPEEAPPTVGTPCLDEAVVDTQVVAHGVPPGAGGCLVVRVTLEDIGVDVGQDHFVGGDSQ